jgi:hypothetical protein
MTLVVTSAGRPSGDLRKRLARRGGHNIIDSLPSLIRPINRRCRERTRFNIASRTPRRVSATI